MATGSKGLTIAARFDRWTARQDLEQLLASSTPATWVGITVTVTLILAASTVPAPARAFFNLRLTLPIVTFAVLLSSSIAFWFVLQPIFRASRRPSRGAFVIYLCSSLLVQFFCATLVASSSLPGAWVFGAMFLYAAGFHGFLLRTNFEEPFLSIGTGLVAALGATLADDGGRLVLAIVGAGGVMVSLVAGNTAVRGDDARSERDRLRLAIDAQRAQEQLRLAVTLEDTLARVLGRGHDAGNTLMSALLHAELLAALLKAEEPLDRPSVTELAKLVESELKVVAELTKQMREEAHANTQRGIQTIDARDALSSATQAQQALHPSKRIELSWAGDGPLAVRVTGGESTLRSVAENLILNACQGDGSGGASHVKIVVEPSQQTQRLTVRVQDDGPGFPAEVATSPITAFRTTKAGGTGVGLFTAERLVRASGGEFRIGNRAEGGAEVVLQLPLDPKGMPAPQAA